MPLPSKKINWRAAGKRFEKKVQSYYEDRGYLVQTAGAVLKWIPGRRFPISHREDMFGAFDGMAVNSDSGIHLYQCTIGVGARIASRKKKVEETARHFPAGVFLELWTRPSRGEMKCETYNKESESWE